MEKTINEIIEALATTGKCSVKGFGTFYTKVKKGREGVSALNGKAYKTEDRIVVAFEQADALDASTYPVK